MTAVKTCCTVLLLVLLSGLLLPAQAERTVGPDVGMDEVLDFYYTVSSSAYPPFDLQYRFYLEDGKKLFFHAFRQGGSWPQTEEDITVSGTLEVDEPSWAAFLDCLEGGTVRNRSEEVLDGDSGPWMYLYWPGDQGVQQEFSFASYQKQIDFEALCSSLAQNHVLTSFHFTRGGYMAPLTYELTLKHGQYLLSENGEDPVLLPPALSGKILQILADDDLESWSGFHKTNPNVLDGEDFRLAMVFADGTYVSAYGENAFPEGYQDASGRLDEVFEEAKRARLAGTYRYEGEGFGGDFTLTLQADGTYTFYEGFLSSYLGGGRWSTDPYAVYLTEENGYDLSFMFVPEGDALIYAAMGSDAFPAVPVADGERFIRLDPKEETMKLFIGETDVPVTWEENPSVEALRELLPLTLDMSMYGGFEQVGPIGRSLPREDQQTTTEAGDLVLYAGNQIVIFYGSNTWAYTRLGHVNLSPEEMTDLLSNGDITLTLRSADE